MPTHQNRKSTQTAAWRDALTSLSPVYPERITATLAVTTALTSIPRTTLYRMLGEGQLRGVKNRRRTLVVWQSVIDYFDSLPNAKFHATNAPAAPDGMGSPEDVATALVAPRQHRGQRP